METPATASQRSIKLNEQEPTMSRLESRAIRDAVRDGIVRAVAIIGLAGFALIHLLDLPDTISGTPYIGWMYIGLIVSAVGLAGALARTSDVRVWAATAALVVSVMVGYLLSRTTGLPQSTDDIGNWGEPLGIAMLFVGGSLLSLTTAVLVGRRSPRRVRVGSERLANVREGRLSAVA
jgi:Na+/proline symporter